MKEIFVNSTDHRLRAGWRILLFVLTFMLCSSLIFIVRPLLGEVSKKDFLTNYSALIVLILALSATLAVYISRRLWDKKSFLSLGLKVDRRTIPDLIFGLLLSAGMAGMFFGVTVLLGYVEFNGFNLNQGTSGNDGAGYVQFISVFSIGALLIFFLEHLLVGYWEELVFRGYVFQNMIEGMGLWIAIIVSCLIYGLLHSSNPNAGWVSSLIIVLFGFLRIYGYLLTKKLWLSMGMHIGWNFFQGPILGFAASGHQNATLINNTPIGPDWLSGGEFGPEGSILILPMIGLALGGMWWWAKDRASSFSFWRAEPLNSPKNSAP